MTPWLASGKLKASPVHLSESKNNMAPALQCTVISNAPGHGKYTILLAQKGAKQMWKWQRRSQHLAHTTMSAKDMRPKAMPEVWTGVTLNTRWMTLFKTV